MIKRKYFMSVEKPHDDGSMNYSFHSSVVTHASLFADPEKVYNMLNNHIAEQLKDTPGDALKVLAFNRI